MSYPQLCKRDDKEKWRLLQWTDRAEQTPLPRSCNCLLLRYGIQPRPTQWRCMLVTLTSVLPPISWHDPSSILCSILAPLFEGLFPQSGFVVVGANHWSGWCRQWQAIMIPMRQQAYHPGRSVNTRQRSVCCSTVISNSVVRHDAKPIFWLFLFYWKKERKKKTIITLSLIKAASRIKASVKNEIKCKWKRTNNSFRTETKGNKTGGADW